MKLGLLLYKLGYRLKLWKASRLRNCAEIVRQALRAQPECAARPHSLALLILAAASTAAVAQPYAGVLGKIFRPFEDVISLLIAMVFGAGILGFVVLIADAVISWITGGSFGRSLAVSKLLRAIETLAVFPLTFFVINVLKELGVPELAEIADIANALLARGWQLIVEVLKGAG